MQYTRYYEKISILAHIWGIIRRFRVLILSIIGLCLASTSAFLGTQGYVYDIVTCPESVPYGDPLTYDASAVFRDVRYEYSEDAAFSTVWIRRRNTPASTMSAPCPPPPLEKPDTVRLTHIPSFRKA